MIDVRPATTADADAVQRIYANCIANADWLPASARSAVDFAQASVGELVYVAIGQDGEIVGFVSVYAPESFVHHLYIVPSARGQGVGRCLLSSLEQWLAAPWRLKCVRANQDAFDFYMQLGWREVACGESEHGAYVLLEWVPNR